MTWILCKAPVFSTVRARRAVATAILLGLATLLPAAAHASAGCSHVTVAPGVASYPLPDMTLRIKRRGNVTCSKAHSLTRTYFRRRAKPHGCDDLGNYCWMFVTRHWMCGIYSAGSSARTNGADAFCQDQRKGGPGFSLFEVLPPGVKQYPQFRALDGRIWCIVGAEAFCVFSSGEPDGGGGGSRSEHSGAVNADGEVALCTVPVVSFKEQCVQNWNPDAPVLKVGQRVELSGYRCVSAADGITCTLLAGPATGSGFRISATGVAELPRPRE